jgi:hypothetical protein
MLGTMLTPTVDDIALKLPLSYCGEAYDMTTEVLCYCGEAYDMTTEVLWRLKSSFETAMLRQPYRTML